MSIHLASPWFILPSLFLLFPVAAHAEPARAASPPPPAASATSSPSPKEDGAPTFRLGIEGGTNLGGFSRSFIAGLRIETFPSPQTSVLLHLSYLHHPDSKGLFEGGTPIASMGFRHYAGALYAGIEAGAVFERNSWAMLQGNFGVKAGPLDLGVSLTSPFDSYFVIPSAVVGIDVVSLWEGSSGGSKPRKARAPVAVLAPAAQR